MTNSVEEIQGMRHGSSIFYDGRGFYYYRNKYLRNVIALKCACHDCPVRAHVDRDIKTRISIRLSVGSHNHAPDFTRIDVMRLRKKLLDRSRNERISLRTIYDEETRGVHEQVASQLMFNSIRVTMLRARNLKVPRNKNGVARTNSLDSPSLPDNEASRLRSISLKTTENTPGSKYSKIFKRGVLMKKNSLQVYNTAQRKRLRNMDSFGIYVGNKLNTIKCEKQRMLAENLITNILTYAVLNKLSEVTNVSDKKTMVVSRQILLSKKTPP